jgi:molybdate transport system substrate-binding protein
MKMMMKNRTCLVLAAITLLGGPGALFAKGQQDASAPAAAPVSNAPVTILVAAAASLKNSYDNELIPLFRQKYPWITVEGTYASSGNLQTQIEQGMAADVFMSAANTQMNNLLGKNLIAAESVKPLLENKVVLIKPKGGATAVTGFQNITAAKIIALGDPASVPAGQYAREILTSLGTWDAVSAPGKASLGTDVTQVLNWVGEGSAEVGVVYATDAISNSKVEILAEAPAGSLKSPVIYPVGIVAASAHPEEAKLFVDFLGSAEGLAIFKSYGFSANN